MNIQVVTGSVYQNCGRFEGIAYSNGSLISSANYAHSLAEATNLLRSRHPKAHHYEVVQHDYDGQGDRVYQIPNV